jgi:UDP-N-acetylmuramoyl-tripeptide--D-alanyl-D-alanine ligase
MNFTAQEIADIVHGQLQTSGSSGSTPDLIIGVRTDSREASAGDLFVPLIAERDGHDFIDAAIAGGATAWLTAREDSRTGAIVVSDPWLALQSLAVAARRRLGERSAPIIGITGSSGKTSTKDLVRGVLLAHGPAGASEKSFNNEIGVPLTLLNAPNDAWAVVVEMGARGLGHISSLCALAQPTIGVVTNVGTAHLGMYSGPGGIVEAKGELVAALPEAGTAVLNATDASLPIHTARTKARVLTFGLQGAVAVGNISVDLTAERVEMDNDLRGRFILKSPWGSVPIQLEARGEHQISNALAAAGATLAAGVSLEEVAAGLRTNILSPWRMEMGHTPTGVIVINDAYNANDQSMAAALRALHHLSAERKIAVLGTMAELGAHAVRAHKSVVDLARELSVDMIIAVNEPLYTGADHHVPNAAAAVELLTHMNLTATDAVLVKGSRMAGLERVAALLGVIQ